MDRNVFLAFALSMGIFTLWLVWQAEREPQPVPTTVEQVVEQAAVDRDTAPSREGAAPTPSPAQTSLPSEAEPRAETAAQQRNLWENTYNREHYTAVLTNRGAGLTSWKLADYTERTGNSEHPLDLLQLDPPYDVVLRTPFRELGLGDLGEAVFEVEQDSPDGATFVHRAGGITVRKAFRFEDPYGLRLTVTVQNESGRVVVPEFGVMWPAAVRTGNDFAEQSLVALSDGDVERQQLASIGHPGFLSNFFGGGQDTGPPTYPGPIDWAGVDEKYFLSVLMPGRPRAAHVTFEALEKTKIGASVISFEPLQIPSGQLVEHEFRSFLGPKRPELLEETGAELTKSIDRGWSWIVPLVVFFEWLLKACYAVIPNYGVAIILVTILVRIVTAPIMSRQMRSTERMRELQPKIKELQEKHADDRQKQSEEMMKLYKQMGVNPLGGCLPMLLQFPVFIGLFYALRSSIDLRQAPFVGWIDDLSAPESLFMIPGIDIPVRVLPLVMGASMIVQQRVTPMTLDPAQARMMTTVMPVMMTVLFYQFPSGLVLYWMVSNLLGIGHQFWIGRGGKRKPPAGSGSPAATPSSSKKMET